MISSYVPTDEEQVLALLDRDDITPEAILKALGDVEDAELKTELNKRVQRVEPDLGGNFLAELYDGVLAHA